MVSLPGGVFNPYSGVKTSILILDKVLAPKTDYVAFFKVGNDGYDLGAQRRPIGKDDLPTVTDEISEYLRRLRAGESLGRLCAADGLLVDKDWIADDGDYNLSGERYRENVAEEFAALIRATRRVSENPAEVRLAACKADVRWQSALRPHNGQNRQWTAEKLRLGLAIGD